MAEAKELCMDCGEEIPETMSGRCRICTVKKNTIPVEVVENSSIVQVKNNIHTVLTADERRVVVTKIFHSPNLYISNVTYEPLCRKFYPQDCKGCPFAQFASHKEVGCKRFIKAKVGDSSNNESNKLRMALFGTSEDIERFAK